MKSIILLVVSIASNIVAFLIAAKFLPGFFVTSELTVLLAAASIYALLNLVLRPIIKLLFGPAIIITLGLAIIVVNAIILYLLTILTTGIRIEGTLTLLYATLILGAVNLVINFSARRILK